MNERDIQTWKQRAALLTGLIVLYISIVFSNKGFSFEIKSADLSWIGWALALTVTVTELVFNGQLSYKQNNVTIYILGVAAYVYGIVSNVIGVWSMQGFVFTSFSNMTISGWFGVGLGVFVELAAEPLVIYGLIGISNTEGDFVGALMNTFSKKRPTPSSNTTRTNFQPKEQPRPFTSSNTQSYQPKPRQQSEEPTYKPQSPRPVGTVNRQELRPAHSLNASPKTERYPKVPPFVPTSYDESDYE